MFRNFSISRLFVICSLPEAALLLFYLPYSSIIAIVGDVDSCDSSVLQRNNCFLRNFKDDNLVYSLVLAVTEASERERENEG